MAPWAFELRRVLKDVVSVLQRRQIHLLVPSRPPPPPPTAPPLPLHPQLAQPLASAITADAPPPPPPPPHHYDASTHSGQVSASEAGPVLSSDSTSPSPEHLLQLLRRDGISAGLKQHWEVVQRLQEREAFSVDQVAWIFDQCRQAPSLKHAKRRSEDEAELPLGNRVVQLFTHFICARIPELTPEQTTCFVEALTSQSVPMDEFWLFMMAKRIQDTTDQFSPEQVATISRCYADNQLEDDEFFGALSARVSRGVEISQFPLSPLASFLFACARVRFLDEAGLLRLSALQGRVTSS